MAVSAPVRATCLFCICARRELIPPAAPPIFVFAIDRPAACLSIFRAPPRRSPYPAQRPRNLHRKTRPAAAPTRPARTCRCSEVQPSAGLRPRREQETPLEPPLATFAIPPNGPRIPRTAVAPSSRAVSTEPVHDQQSPLCGVVLPSQASRPSAPRFVFSCSRATRLRPWVT